MSETTFEIPSISVDAARASVTPHTIHLELARSGPDGVFLPIAHMSLPATAAAELAVLLARSAERCAELRELVRLEAAVRED